MINLPFTGTLIGSPRFLSHVIDAGSGDSTLFLHGSGPGASGLANWQGTLSARASGRSIAIDLVGFGESTAKGTPSYTVGTWAEQAFEVMDSLSIERFAVVGNSLGGRIAMEMALMHPDRIDRLVLMGSGGLLLEPTPALKALRDYVPSVESMRHLIEHVFLFDSSLSNDDLVQRRFEASVATYDRYRGMFSADRSGLMISPERIAAIQSPALVVHGRDDLVIPVSNGVRIAELLPDADLHVFARCGHWAQFERAKDFDALIASFLTPAQ